MSTVNSKSVVPVQIESEVEKTAVNTSGCILMVMTSSLSVGVRPGMIGLGGSRVETSIAFAKARASSFSTSSLQGHSSSCSEGQRDFHFHMYFCSFICK